VIFERFGAWLRRLSNRDGDPETPAEASAPPAVAGSVNGTNGYHTPADGAVPLGLGKEG
jgi:hypothetical protein